MVAMTDPRTSGQNLQVLPKHGVDRKALRAEINKRYEHTLRRLGQ